MFVVSWVAAASFQTPAAVSVEIGQNFRGSTFGIASDSVPADSNGAVGPRHFVEFINGRFSVYEKSTGKRVLSKTDLAFWNAAGVTFSTSAASTDPRILYDGYSQRWFASMVDFTIRQNANRFLLAASATADPAGKWSGFGFRADPVSGNFADFPTLGVDPVAVYLSGDMFDRLGNGVGPTLVAIPKTGLLANTPSIAARTSLGALSYSTRGNILQPAITTGNPTTPEFCLATADILTDFQPLTTLVASTVENADIPGGATLSKAVRITVPPYDVPLNPPQPDGSDNLDDGDLRFGAAVRRVSDLVYAVHAVQIGDRAAVRWYKINAVTSTLVEAGTITDPDLDLFYPSIAANEAGTVVIGCNGSSASVFISSYAIVGEVINGTLTFGNPILLQSGTDSYQNPDVTGTSRWGDYSATCVDPEDPTRFWTIQAIAVGSRTWATQVTELITGTELFPGVRLAVTPLVGDLVLSWPSAAADFQLQQSPTLGPEAVWTPVPETPALTNNTATVILTPGPEQGFFRLMRASTAASP